MRKNYMKIAPTIPQNAVVLPASFAQRRLWFMDQLDPHNPAYTISATLHFHGRLDIQTLQQSLQEIVQRHEVLRTRFVAIDGEIMQVIYPDVLAHIHIHTHTGAINRAPTLMAEAAKAFDLAQGPLWRVMLFQMDFEHYTLFLLIHHIIADGWSIGLFFEELTTLYTAFSSGQPATLPALPIQYADFAIWQRENLSEERLATDLHYWRQQLANVPYVLELPTDRPRSHHQTHNGATYTFALSRQLTTALKTFSSQEGVTLYMTLVAAFQTLLHRYTGHDDLVIGSPIAQRQQPEVQNLLGLFLNSVALRTNFSGNPTVRDLLARVREVVLDAHAHQDLPFERLVRELNPQRSAGHSPLFQVTLQLDPPMPFSSTQWTLTRMFTDTGATKFDLSLELEDHPDGLVGHLEYSTDLFDASTIARMATHWETLLQAMIDDPTQLLSRLPLLTDAERQHILFDWNNTHAVYPRTATLSQLFEAQVERTPKACAVMFNDILLSYQTLNKEANQFAHYLQKRRIKPGARVALCYEHSHELIVALLGILKAGGTYVPLDPADPPERLAFMLADSQATALVTQQHLLEHLPQTTPVSNVICMDRAWRTIQRENPRNPGRLVSSEDPAYMLYTSGSTGTPKGVLGTHRAAINRFNWMWRSYPFAPDEVCCHKTSLNFVGSIWEIFGPLLQGISTVIIPAMIVKDTQLFLQTLAAHKVTRIVLLPSHLRALFDSNTALKTSIPSLKYWICRGEVLPLELVQRFQQQLPERTLLNLYGSPEVAADATCYEIKNTSDLSCIPLGRPIDNIQIYLLDRCMQPVPVGVPGELYVGGDGLALGYFKHPELTATKFVRHSIANQGETLLYKTGDRARYLPDGTIEYLGRLDHYVRQLTPNGKVDPRALSVLDSVSETTSDTYLAPSLMLHHQLVQIWEELLTTRPIGIRDDFFVLGGHSFLALRLMTRIEQMSGQKLPLSTLFAGATIEHMANVLQAANQASTTRTPITPIQASGTKRPFFFLHGDWQGKPLYCLKLTETLGDDQPFYILENYKYADLDVLPTLKEVAAAHLAAVRAVQPEGPYTLGGWSHGALFAYEMAQQLQAARQQVTMLVLMEPGSSTFTSRFLRRAIQQVNRLFHLQEVQQLDYFLRLLHLYEYVRLWNYHKKLDQRRRESEGTEGEIEPAQPNFHMPWPSRADLRQNYISIFNWWASAYKIEPYVGKVALFWTREDDAKKRKYWEHILADQKEVEVYMVPGTYVTSRTKYVDALAASLRECLHKISGSPSLQVNAIQVKESERRGHRQPLYSPQVDVEQ